jgi:hypothetical protein
MVARASARASNSNQRSLEASADSQTSQRERDLLRQLLPREDGTDVTSFS